MKTNLNNCPDCGALIKDKHISEGKCWKCHSSAIVDAQIDEGDKKKYSIKCSNCHTTYDKYLTKCQCGYQFQKNKDNPIDISMNRTDLAASNNANHVIINDIRMSFTSMVIFMVKWVLASIPALIILFIIGIILFSLLGIGIGTAVFNGLDPSIY